MSIDILPPAQARAFIDAVTRRGVLRYRLLASSNVQWAAFRRGLATRRMSEQGPVFRLNSPGRSVGMILARNRKQKKESRP